MSEGNYSSYIVVSDETIEKLGYEKTSGYMVVSSSDPYNLEIEISRLHENLQVSNYLEYKKQMDSLIVVISIFLYGFITVITIIGLTNVINTLTTSLNLRKKEFAMLKAVGTTKKEFKQIINLECIFLGTKVLIIGIPIGLLLSYLIYYFIVNVESTVSKYNPNILSLLISAVSVFIIVKVIMSYQVKRINKQNIIETIRNDII
jgi:putative ABC transport system permease protein